MLVFWRKLNCFLNYIPFIHNAYSAFLLKTVGFIWSNTGFSFPNKSNILIFNIHTKTDGHQCSRQVSLTGDIFATQGKEKTGGGECRNKSCYANLQMLMAWQIQKGHIKKKKIKSLIKKYLYLI